MARMNEIAFMNFNPWMERTIFSSWILIHGWYE
jgi:hypothetical protein